jgi:hypothetical protein
MPKPIKKLQELSQTHGKIEDTQYKTLDQIWGDDGSSKYKTSNLQDYLNYLNDLNKSDLQDHAKKIGLIPIDNRETLTKRLTSEFRKYMSMFKLPKNSENLVNLDKKSKDILSEGK